ncbi:putative quinol monooxygenase [Kitasatospora sp. MBT63]|uniref:putative quinol monooxygenase n=1 Tax=Kitasatospora sp. MBT63 TaxID=1444768 RepID=UPI001E54D594|nr:antibiotic biosynthesis monooxygenase [Kitasatospora sp. MBT63]
MGATTMNIGLLARIEAKPEYADQVETMLREAVRLANEEAHTTAWFAFRENATTFGVFDTFENEEGRAGHLGGKIAATLMEAAQTMLSSAPDIRPVDLLGVKLP